MTPEFDQSPDRGEDIRKATKQAFARLQHGDAKRAGDDFRQILDRDPRLVPARYGFAVARIMNGAPEEAFELLQALIHDEPGYVPAIVDFGNVAAGLDRPEAAVAVLNDAVARVPESDELKIVLAQCLFALEHYDDAERLIASVLAKDPAQAKALFRRARIADRRGALDAAITGYRGALAHGYPPRLLQPFLAKCQFRVGKRDEAEETCRAVIDRPPHDALALFVLTQCFRNAGQFNKAEASYLGLLRSRAFSQARTLAFLGKAARQENSRELKEIVRASWAEYGEILRGQGWFENAMAEAQRPLIIEPENAFPITAETATPRKSPHRITLISFGTDEFRDGQAALTATAFAHGGIATAVHWTPALLQATQFFRNHAALLSRPRGAGYWAWKPFLILQQMLRIPEGDYVLYHDCGTGDYTFARDVAPLLTWCARNGYDALPGAQWPSAGPNRHWTKGDCFALMDCDDARYKEHPQIMATFSLWKNTAWSREFVKRWLTFSIDPRIISDYPNVLAANDDGFIDHRHDQSILTNLVVRHGMTLPIHENKNINKLIAALGA